MIIAEGLFQFGTKLLDKLFPDPEQKAKAMLELERMKQTGELAQLTAETELAKAQTQINQVEAASQDRFVSRWRPFIGWVCGVAFAYHFVAQPLLAFLLAAGGHKVELPVFDMDALSTVLLGMLGLGSMRTIEKIKRKS